MTDEELYQQKNTWLSEQFTEVDPDEFYREVFPVGSFEHRGQQNEKKPNGILTIIKDEQPAKNRIIFDDLEELQRIHEGRIADFVVTSPMAYLGKNRTSKNARVLYGFAIDLDGVGMQQLRDLFFQMQNEVLPTCTFCVNSGHGLHLYYLLEKPINLFPELYRPLNDLKHELTAKVWNRYTSTYTERNEVQYQSIFQGYRVVGSASKLGWDYPVRAYKTGIKVTLAYLNQFLMDETKAIQDLESYRTTPDSYQSKISLEEAKEKYPEWYEKRIVKGEVVGRWQTSRALYDWWLEKIKVGASVGHRYYCLAVLAAYGVKCGVPYLEVKADCMALLNKFDALSDDSHNRFTVSDVRAALHFYAEEYATLSRAEVERMSGITVQANKRNYRKQKDHLQLARGIRKLKSDMGEDVNGTGRPDKRDQVFFWRQGHPNGKKVDCIRDTGLAKSTVYKWWDAGSSTPPIVIHAVRKHSENKNRR